MEDFNLADLIMQITGSLKSHIVWKTLGLGIQLLITVCLSRILGAAESGKFFYYISWLTFFILLGSGGLDTAITYFLAAKKISKAKLVFLVISWLLIIISVLSFLGYLFIDQLQFLKSFPEQSFGFGLLYISGYLLINFFTSFFYGEQIYVFPSKFISILNLVFVLVLLFHLWFPISPFTNLMLLKIYIGFIVFQGLALGVGYLFNTKFEISRFLPGFEEIIHFFSYGFIAFWANLLFFSATRIDYWILNKFNVSETDIGNYIQVSRIVQLFQMFPSVLAVYFFPKTAAAGDKIIPYLIILIRWVLIINIILILPVVFVGSYLFPFIFGNSFDQMYILFLFYMPGLISLSVLSLMSAYFAGINKVAINMCLSIATLVIVLVGNSLFVNQYGVKAAAGISSIAYTISCFWAFTVFLKNTGMTYKDVLGFRKSDLRLLRYKLSQITSSDKEAL